MTRWPRRGHGFRALVTVTACALAAVIAVAVLHARHQAPAGTGRGMPAGLAQVSLRNGWDPDEPRLSPASVRSAAFGPLFSTTVDGAVLAQPVVAGGTVVVATENDRLYGLDAVTGSVTWARTLGTPVPNAPQVCAVLGPSSGVTSTPVYDPRTGTVYLVAQAGGQPGAGPQFLMYAIRASTGTVRWRLRLDGTPVNDPGRPFRPAGQLQRPGLLLAGGWVYAAFGPRCEGSDPYSGYVAGVDTATRAQTMWADEAGTDNGGGGIWQSGSGLMSDGPGRIFLAVGNGVSPPAGPGRRPPGDLGDSVVRLGVQRPGALAARDFFSPAGAAWLDTYDTDLGSGGPTGLPFGTRRYPHLLAQAGKSGRLLLLNRDSLGGREQGPGGTDAVVAQAGPFASGYGRTAAFAGRGGADYLYYAGAADYLRALRLTGQGSRPALADVANSTATLGYASGSPVVTSAGADPRSAVVWVVAKNGGNGALEAFGGMPQRSGGALVLKQIWSAPVSLPANFATAATGGGRVYVATRAGQVYGFGSDGSAPLSAAAAGFGPVATGAAAHTVVTVTARSDVTVTSITTATAAGEDPFTAGAPASGHKAVTLPVTLSRGQRLAVPVTFAPTAAGGTAGWLTFATTQPRFPAVSISLSGEATRPGLAGWPPSQAFLNTFSGSARSAAVDITNFGTQDAAVRSVTPPRPPFRVTGLPGPGSVLRPGETRTVLVTYAPARPGADRSGFTLTLAGGSRLTEYLSGSATAGRPALSARPVAVRFGEVRPGHSRTRVVRLSDPGNLPVTITGVSCPSGPFRAGTVAAGQQLGPGEGLRVPVTFTPARRGAATAAFRVRLLFPGGRPGTATVTLAGTGGAAPGNS